MLYLCTNMWNMKIEKELEAYRQKLRKHPLYENINSLEDIKTFMESHVFAVWDFMSLLKFLQLKLTSINVPWLPKSKSNTARFINEIVLAEESDVNEVGEVKSHFEMYLDAMNEIGADTKEIKDFMWDIQNGVPCQEAIQTRKVSKPVKDFLSYTFEVIDNGKTHEVASAFTFGREDIIPEMFIEILEQIDPNKAKYKKLRYYLDRHIELDGDEHGPMSLKMMDELCEDNENKWSEVISTAQQALQARNNLWLSIHFDILKDKKSQLNEMLMS